MQTEGGFADSPDDHGGATDYGLSLRYLAQQAKLVPSLVAELDINHDGVIDLPDIEGMTMATASDVYFRFLWTAPGASTLPQPFDAAVFDQIVNDGQIPAIKMLQQACNALGPQGAEPLVVDGGIGPATRARLNILILQKGADAVLDAYKAQVVFRYRYIANNDPSQVQFLAGWLNRAAELGDV